MTKNISKYLRIRLGHCKHLPARLLTSIVCVSGKKHRAHLKPFVKQQLTLVKACLLYDDKSIVVAYFMAVRIRQSLIDTQTFG